MTMTYEETQNSLAADDVKEVDFNAPEPGSMPPPLVPGTYKFIFHLIDETEDNKPFETVEQKDDEGNMIRSYRQVNFVAEVLKDDGTTVRVPFQRASSFQTEKMANSRMGDLVRSLGLNQEYLNARMSGLGVVGALEAALEQANGNKAGRAEFAWTVAFKESLTIYSTAATKVRLPKKPGGYTIKPWPTRELDGSFTPAIGEGGQKKFARLEITRFRLPE